MLFTRALHLLTGAEAGLLTGFVWAGGGVRWYAGGLVGFAFTTCRAATLGAGCAGAGIATFAGAAACGLCSVTGGLCATRFSALAGCFGGAGARTSIFGAGFGAGLASIIGCV